jgi:hypothetical protein
MTALAEGYRVLPSIHERRCLGRLEEGGRVAR